MPSGRHLHLGLCPWKIIQHLLRCRKRQTSLQPVTWHPVGFGIRDSAEGAVPHEANQNLRDAPLPEADFFRPRRLVPEAAVDKGLQKSVETTQTGSEASLLQETERKQRAVEVTKESASHRKLDQKQKDPCERLQQIPLEPGTALIEEPGAAAESVMAAGIIMQEV